MDSQQKRKLPSLFSGLALRTSPLTAPAFRPPGVPGLWRRVRAVWRELCARRAALQRPSSVL